MIDEPPLLTIAKSCERPDKDLVGRFRDVPTSFICDAMGGQGALDWRIKPISEPHMVGIALTCNCGPADILALSAAVALSKACRPLGRADVIVGRASVRADSGGSVLPQRSFGD